MKNVLQIPSDVGETCRAAAQLLTQENARLSDLWDTWTDTDPDPEHGFYWTVNIDHPEVDRLRRHLNQITQFLDWLADHGEHGEAVEVAHERG